MKNLTAEDFRKGQVLLVDKPLEWTSFHVVKKIRFMLKYHRGLKKIKVGHAGTLDPLATGLLVICTGKMTKSIPSFQEMEKEYTGTLKLGATTPSYDAETEADQTFPTDHISEAMIRETAQAMEGETEQIPPVFSALQVEGERAYILARKGEKPRMKAKSIIIYNFDIRKVNMPEVEFRVRCSKGTYIRSLAYDLGKKLDSGAYLTSLKRTRIGDFLLENSTSLEDLEKQLKS